MSSQARILNCRAYLDIYTLVVYICHGAFFFAAALKIIIVRFMCVDVCGRKLGSLFYFYREAPGRSRDYSPKQRGRMFQNVCVQLCTVYCIDVRLLYICERAPFSFHIFIQHHWGLHKEFQSPDEKEGAVAAEL